MQLIIKHKLPRELVLPIHYHHILQSIIYHNLREDYGYSDFLHEKGYASEERQYRMFVFGLLQGRYEIVQKNIVFRNEVSFRVRSADNRMLRLLKENLERRGINYLQQHYEDLELELLLTYDISELRAWAQSAGFDYPEAEQVVALELPAVPQQAQQEKQEISADLPEEMYQSAFLSGLGKLLNW